MRKVRLIIVILIVAGLAFWAGGRYGKDQAGGRNSEPGRTVLYYVDPMNPGFRTDKPGVAPCGMPLEPVYAEEGEKQAETGMHGTSMSPGAVKISPAQQQLIGVKVAAAKESPMTYTLRLYGKVVPDETRVYRINASTDAWIRELSDATTGSIVSKNQILAEALAPAYFNAQVTYLIALDNIDRIQQQLGAELRHQQADIADNQIRVAVQALQNLGITDAQIEDLANTRRAQPYLQVRSPVRGVILNRSLTLYEWFKAGEEFYSIADIGKIWVYADVYEDEAMHLSPGMKVQVKHAQMNRTFNARVSKVLPLFDPVAKTLKVRLDVENPRYDLRPDMFVDIEIPITMPPSLHLPADAVVDSGTSTIVYVDMGDGIFEPRQVEPGWRLGRQVQITGGLMPGEKVAVSGNFLIDSESRMKTAASGIHGPMAKDPVCGMYVDEEKAGMSGLVAQHGDKTFFFCSEKCKKDFEKKPVLYVKKGPASSHKKDHAAMPGTDRSWLDAIKPADRSQRKNKSVEKTRQKAAEDDTLPRTSMTPGVVDWNGPEPEGSDAPAPDWGLWGNFPGAKYLGLKDGKKSASPLKGVKESGTETAADEEQSTNLVAPSSAPGAKGSQPKVEKPEQPVFRGLVSPEK